MSLNRTLGFTLIEVLLAVFIFGLIATVVLKSTHSSQKITFRSEEVFEATNLAQEKMVEMELKFQKAVDQNGVEQSYSEEEGVFEEPYSNYKWEAKFKESSFEFTDDHLIKLMKSLGMDDFQASQQLESSRLLMTNINKTFKSQIGELLLTVKWTSRGRSNQIQLVTHLIAANPKIELTTTAESSLGGGR